MGHQLRHDDPLYYKIAMRGLMEEAAENRIKVYTKDNMIYFKSDIGECTGVSIEKEE